jgi:sulfate adenylyltransferase subunit 2
MFVNKLKDTKSRISEWVRHYANPCVLWSGGKDSTVLLHLLRKMGHDFPCITFQEPWQRGRLDYTQRIADEWNLTVYDFPPSRVGLNRGNGRIDFMQLFQMGNFEMWLLRGTEPPLDREPYQCGVEWLKRPVGGMQFPWDAAFHGHKSSDEDPCSGKIPLLTDIITAPGALASLYPLREWTDEDVFTYAEIHRLQLDPLRYGRIDGEMAVLKNDKVGNPDYYRTCTACLDPDQPDVVWCPKLKAQINNVSANAPWVKLDLPLCGYQSMSES